MYFVKNHLFFMSLYSELYFPIFSPPSVIPRPRCPPSSFFFDLQRLVRPQGYYRTHVLLTCSRVRQHKHSPVSRKREAKRRRILLTIRLDGEPPTPDGFARIARISKRRQEGRRKCSCRENISNLLYLD